MKEVIYIDSFIDLERQYLSKHNPYLIEESLLYSFSKNSPDCLINSLPLDVTHILPSIKEYLPNF